MHVPEHAITLMIRLHSSKTKASTERAFYFSSPTISTTPFPKQWLLKRPSCKLCVYFCYKSRYPKWRHEVRIVLSENWILISFSKSKCSVSFRKWICSWLHELDSVVNKSFRCHQLSKLRLQVEIKPFHHCDGGWKYILLLSFHQIINVSTINYREMCFSKPFVNRSSANPYLIPYTY